MSKIILTEEEIDVYKPLVESVILAQTAFTEASRMLKESKKSLWKVIMEKYPETINFYHPEEEGGSWAITINDLVIPDEVA